MSDDVIARIEKLPGRFLDPNTPVLDQRWVNRAAVLAILRDSPANVSSTGPACELHHVHSETEPCSAVIDRWDAAWEDAAAERRVARDSAVTPLRKDAAVLERALATAGDVPWSESGTAE